MPGSYSNAVQKRIDGWVEGVPVTSRARLAIRGFIYIYTWNTYLLLETDVGLCGV